MMKRKKKKNRNKKAAIVIACLSSLLLLFNSYFLTEKAETLLPRETLSDRTDLPQLANNRKEQLINHEGFTVSYNADYRIANWTAYELTAEEAKGGTTKKSNFSPDPEVIGVSATNKDYKHSGYDRGHLVPRADMKWSEEGTRASYYFSNICPQNRKLNAGLWSNLERQCRTWAKKYGAIDIVTGPVITDSMARLGGNSVAIPDKFYKVVSSTAGGKARSIGFLVENRNYENTLLKEIAVPVDSIESVTGIRFFTSFPMGTQLEMKSVIDWSYWKFNKSKNVL